MISTSFCVSTGVMKWMATNFSGRAVAVARPVIGRVEVLLAKKPPGASRVSTSLVTLALSSRFSNTASMISSQPCRSFAELRSHDAREQRLPAPAGSCGPLSTRGCVRSGAL